MRAAGSTVPAILRRYAPVAVLVLLWSFHALSSVVWLRMDQTLPFDDEAFNALGGLQCLELLGGLSWSRLGELAIFTVDDHPHYPPLVYVTRAIFHLVGGPSMAVSKLANLPFMAVLIAAVYGIGKKMMGRSMGVFAAFLASMYPMVTGLSRSTQPDFALTAMVALSLYCLLLTEGFTKRWPSVGFGVSVGLGMLTKEMFAAFLLPAFVVAVVAMLRRPAPRRAPGDRIHGGSRTALRHTCMIDWLGQRMDTFRIRWERLRAARGAHLLNLLLAVGLAVLIAGTWYVSRIDGMLRYFTLIAYWRGPADGPSTMFSATSLLYYADQMARQQVIGVLFLLFLFGLIDLCRRRGPWTSYLLWSLIGPYIIFTLIYAKTPKYTVPYLPVVALISAAAVWKIRRLGVRRTAVCLIVCFGIVQYLSVSFGLKAIDASVFARFPSLRAVIPGRELQWTPMKANSSTTRRWEALEHLLLLLEREQPPRRQRRLVVHSQADGRESYELANVGTVKYFCQLRGLSYSIVYERLNPAPDVYIANRELDAFVPPRVVEDYALLERLQLPDESAVYVYQRRARDRLVREPAA